MLNVERIRMQLPAGYEHRASSIVRLLGEELAQIQLSENRTLDRLSITPVKVSPNATDQEIAHAIAEQMALAIGAGT